MAVKISQGRQDTPKLIILYARDGIGKTSLAASAPHPIILDIEKGSGELEIDRLEGFEKFDEVVQAVDLLIREPKHYKTIVIDSLTKIEPMVWSMFEDPGYGRGADIALVHWRKLTSALDRARAAGFNIILTAHAWPAPANDPTVEIPYDKLGLRLEKKTAAFFREWVYGVWYLTQEVLVKKEKGAAKGKAIHTGDAPRVLYTVGRSAFDAKSRYDVGDEIEIPPTGGWRAIFESKQDLKADLEILIPQIQDADIKQKAIDAATSGKHDLRKLLARVIEQIESEKQV